MPSAATTATATTAPAARTRAEPNRAEPTRDALVRVAGELLERDGLAAVTLREVGGRAGVSRSAPYRHFAGKDALLAAVAAADMRALGAQVAAAGAPARRPVRRVERMLGAYLDFAAAHPERYGLIYAPALRDDPELKAAADAAVDGFAAAVEACMSAGDLGRGDPRQVGGLLVATAHGAAELARTGHLTEAKWGTDARGIVRLLLRGLAR